MSSYQDRKTLEENGISHIDAHGTCFRLVTDTDTNGTPTGSRIEQLNLPAISWNYGDGAQIKMSDRDALEQARVRAYRSAGDALRIPEIQSSSMKRFYSGHKSKSRKSRRESGKTSGGEESRSRTHDDPAHGGQGSSTTAAATMPEGDHSLSYEVMTPEQAANLFKSLTAEELHSLEFGTGQYQPSEQIDHSEMINAYLSGDGAASAPYTEELDFDSWLAQ
ncbi:hypothetical protein L202_00968 [Cryptococcus amylolentus CBS 6039]|uniref:Uncharacterized protein n=2 Tax=Cryptococcus amylolentus TaxID=104669 RepID=A0A1E3I259_9TREE|nr:hypothetical protein L202_00968 [Cryptococcus amylolentus CBS 6039]ODN82674.1 hypothetical protein L202_00968 [Cryptococcus amylolentus CBS 6039]ODO10368.1 hypothetical protein I350_00963 [Cryptococcus amylolentus CBS 6273]